jgi:peptidoglycan/LPS O-acetylase OafA/YrhL
MEIDKQGRFALVDALRGIAALLVVLHHLKVGDRVNNFLSITPDFVVFMFDFGYLGVYVFFVLSGFVIAHSLDAKEMTKATFSWFALKRCIRLDPPYWAAILLTIIYSVASTYVLPGKTAPEYSVGQIFAHAFYLQDILRYQPISPIFWTLCLEIQFYLVYAFIVATVKNTPIVLTALCVFSLLWPLGLGPAIPKGLFLEYWYAFLAGVAVYWAWRHQGFLYRGIAFLGVLWSAGVLRQEPAVLVSALTAALLLAACYAAWIQSGLNWRWLQFLGLISYSLYLTHNMSIGATFRLGEKVIGSPSIVAELGLLVTAMFVSIGTATIFWWLIERPSTDLSKSIRLTGKTEPLAQAQG